jgi:hypothetical protein
VSFAVQVYTQGVRWKGNLMLPIPRRLSDYLNDTGANYCMFDHLTLDTPGNRVSTQLNLPMDRVAMQKNNMIAVTTSKSTSPLSVASSDRINKEVNGIKIIIPPLVIFGVLHIVSGTEWSHVLNLLNQKFLSLTDAVILSLDQDQPLDDHADYVAVNFQRIIAAVLLDH